MSKPTILLGLNEINFDYIKFYIKQGLLPSFQKLLDKYPLIETQSEDDYNLLEPWIQWVTIHTGLTYEEHQVFRLGDITERKDLEQIWERLEAKGLSIGAVSPFNCDNRLKNPKFFIPDPWTKTNPSGNWLIKGLSDAVQQSVNENAQSKLSLKSLVNLMAGASYSIPPLEWSNYLSLSTQLKSPGVKAIVLDKLLGDVFFKLWKQHQPDFSSLFLNTGAHIQHHYLFNSEAYQGTFENPEWYCPKDYDPLKKVLIEYDNILKRLLDLDCQLIIATGLHQKPHKHLTYYWRLNKHKDFIEKIGIQDYIEILPRMSRDFLINFSTIESAAFAEEKLANFRSDTDQISIFSVDNRGKSLFIELTYPNNIQEDMSISSTDDISIPKFKNYISFVAIKNGEHDSIGYLLTNFSSAMNGSRIPLKQVNELLFETAI